jgi:hypothetical protein
MTNWLTSWIILGKYEIIKHKKTNRLQYIYFLKWHRNEVITSNNECVHKMEISIENID